MIKMGESSQDAWKVVPITAKNNPEEASEFVEGTLFFGVWKNHVVLHQSSACRADQFQQHANWLLRKVLEEATDDQGKPVPMPTISLADPLPPDLR